MRIDLQVHLSPESAPAESVVLSISANIRTDSSSVFFSQFMQEILTTVLLQFMRIASVNMPNI